MRNWMKSKREERGLTLKQVGDAMGISESYYKLIEDGARQRTLDLTTAEKIGKLFGLSLPQIAALEEQEGA